MANANPSSSLWLELLAVLLWVFRAVASTFEPPK